MKIGISIEIGIPKEVLQWAKRYGESADMTRKTMKELNECKHHQTTMQK